MSRVVSFYEKLPRGKAPAVEPKGFVAKYRAKHFGDKPSATRMSPDIELRIVSHDTDCDSNHPSHCSFDCHWLCAALLLPLPYVNSECPPDVAELAGIATDNDRSSQEQRSLVVATRDICCKGT